MHACMHAHTHMYICVFLSVPHLGVHTNCFNYKQTSSSGIASTHISRRVQKGPYCSTCPTLRALDLEAAEHLRNEPGLRV